MLSNLYLGQGFAALCPHDTCPRGADETADLADVGEVDRISLDPTAQVKTSYLHGAETNAELGIRGVGGRDRAVDRGGGCRNRATPVVSWS